MALFVLAKVRPVKISTLFLTYVVPLIPLMIFWDAMVSNFRTYTVREFENFIADLKSSDYEWRIEDVRFFGVPYKLTVLKGVRLTANS
jgi:hypothetical protein